MMIRNYISNGWNVCHTLGSGLTNWLLFFIIETNMWLAFGLAIVPTTVKELIDCICKRNSDNLFGQFLIRIGFDPAGGDWRDVGMAILGTLIAILIIIIKGYCESR